MAIVGFQAKELKDATYGGLIREDVMEEISQISPIDVPFKNMIGEERSTAMRKEWTIDTLAAVDTDNAVSEGDDLTGESNKAKAGTRVSNLHQISVKKIQLTDRAEYVEKVGGGGKAYGMAYQLIHRQNELFRDMEACITGIQASVADNPGSAVGKLGALGSWIATCGDKPGDSAFGYFNTSTGLTTAPTTGTKRALSEKMIRDSMQEAFTEGGDPKYLMGTPTVIRLISEYLFTSSARVATITSNVQTSDIKKVRGKNDDMHQGVTAIGSVNVIVSDFGTLTLLPNRFQQTVASGVSHLYGIDPDYWAISYLQKPVVKQHARTALAETRVISVDYTLISKNEAANFAILSIDQTLAMVSGA